MFCHRAFQRFHYPFVQNCFGSLALTVIALLLLLPTIALAQTGSYWKWKTEDGKSIITCPTNSTLAYQLCVERAPKDRPVLRCINGVRLIMLDDKPTDIFRSETDEEILNDPFGIEASKRKSRTPDAEESRRRVAEIEEMSKRFAEKQESLKRIETKEEERRKRIEAKHKVPGSIQVVATSSSVDGNNYTFDFSMTNTQCNTNGSLTNCNSQTSGGPQAYTQHTAIQEVAQPLENKCRVVYTLRKVASTIALPNGYTFPAEIKGGRMFITYGRKKIKYDIIGSRDEC